MSVSLPSLRIPLHTAMSLSGTKRLIFLMISISFFMLFIVRGYAHAGDEILPWHITADRIVNLAEKNLYLAEGNVTISKGDEVLIADKVTYNSRLGIIRAEGNVSLSSAGDILRCDEGTFNLNEKTGYLSYGSLFLTTSHFYIRGQDIWKTGPATYLIKGCRITSCDGENPDWSITGSEVEVTIEGYGTVKHAAFFVRHIPLLYFPYIIFPAKRKRQTGFLPPSIGYSERNGIDIEVPLFWAISQQTDATFYERYLGKRGLKHGVEFRYLTGANSKGALLYDTISDKRDEKDMYSKDDLEISPYPRSNQKRYWFRGRADQSFPFGFVSRLDVDFLSDYDYLREFNEPSLGSDYRVKLDEESGRPLEEIQSPTRRSAIRVSRDFQDFSFQALGSYYQRPEHPEEDTTAQPLAGLDLTILPRKIPNLPVFFSLGSDYGYVYRDTGQKGQRLSLTPSMSYPLWPFPYLELEPSVKYLVTTQWLDEFEGHKGQQTKDAYELGVRLSTILERIFNVETGSIKRIKHKFQPSISYSFRPYEDEEEYDPWFEPIDNFERLNSISLSLDNYIHARKEDEKGRRTYSQVASFSLTQDYDLDEATEELDENREPFSPLEVTLDLTPYPSLDIAANLEWDHYGEYFSSASISLDLTVKRTGARQDSYAVDYVYGEGSTKTLNYEVNINLLYGFSTGAQGKRDLILNYNIENSYWIDYESQCWGLKLIYEDLDEDKRIMLSFRLLGIGDVGSF